MSVRRLAATAAAMAGIGVLLCVLTHGPVQAVVSLAAPQRLVDVEGPGALVLSLTGGLAWLTWGWGALGLLLTAAGALPGVVGAAARLAQRLLLPGAGRRAAALLLGVGVGLGSPGLIGSAAAQGSSTSAPGTSTTTAPSLDWPTAAAPDRPTAPVPDWPSTSPADGHVVVRGDCLWHIARSRLAQRSGRPPTNAQTALAVQAWWRANAEVIGPDPDRLLPGQLLRPPDTP